MTGKRVLDLVALLKASRGVASQIALISRDRYNVYSKTSSLVHALQSQVEQASSAINITKTQGQASKNDSLSADNVIPNEGKDGAPKVQKTEHALTEDLFYKRSDQNSAADPAPSNTIDIKQETARQRPLPDGTIPSDGDSSSSSANHVPFRPSSGKARTMQRASEHQIPSQSAEPPPVYLQTDREKEFAGLHVDQEQDVFFQAPRKIGAVVSALPRVKIPKNSETVQEIDEHLPRDFVNREVFYSTIAKEKIEPIENTNAASDDHHLPDETYSQLFQSPKVARMMSAKEPHNSSKTAKSSNVPTSNSEDDLQQLGSNLASDLSNGVRDSGKVMQIQWLQVALLID